MYAVYVHMCDLHVCSVMFAGGFRVGHNFLPFRCMCNLRKSSCYYDCVCVTVAKIVCCKAADFHILLYHTQSCNHLLISTYVCVYQYDDCVCNSSKDSVLQKQQIFRVFANYYHTHKLAITSCMCTQYERVSNVLTTLS